jgi:hypothetical protein
VQLLHCLLVQLQLLLLLLHGVCGVGVCGASWRCQFNSAWLQPCRAAVCVTCTVTRAQQAVQAQGFSWCCCWRNRAAVSALAVCYTQGVCGASFCRALHLCFAVVMQSFCVTCL